MCKNTDHGDAPAQEFGVQGQFFQSFGRSREEQIIDRFLIGPGKAAKSRWQGEGYEEVVFWEQQVHLSFEPEIGCVVSTFRTVAVFAGVVAVAGLPALVTKIDMAAHGLRAAVFDVLHGLEVRRGHAIGETWTGIPGHGGERCPPTPAWDFPVG